MSDFNDVIETIARKMEMAQYRDITDVEFIAEIRALKRPDAPLPADVRQIGENLLDAGLYLHSCPSDRVGLYQTFINRAYAALSIATAQLAYARGQYAQVEAALAAAKAENATLRVALQYLVNECDQDMDGDYNPHAAPLANARAALKPEGG